jgi:glutamate-1-semialdehyde 2,1-aminomutase
VFFSEQHVIDYDDARGADRDAFERFFGAMLERGIYLPPSPFEAWFPSLAHSDEHLEQTVEAAAESFAIVAAG